MLSKKNAYSFISKLLSPKQHPEFTILEIHKHFVYSLEIVGDEHCDWDKYNYLNFIEFMEFLCRIAFKLFEDKKEEGLDYKM